MTKIVLGKKHEEAAVNKVIESQNLPLGNTILPNRIEIKEKRTIYEKHYKNNDGTFTMELNNQPVHYLDPATNNYEEIDNNLVEVENYLKVRGNSFDISFAKELNNEHFLKLNNGNKEISLKFVGSYNRNNKNFKINRAIYKSSGKLNTDLIYKDVALNTDLEYKINSNKIKENIIIKKCQDKYEYEFEMDIKELKPQLSKDEKTIELVDSINNQVKFIIPSPIMYDANHNKSLDVSYEFEAKSEGILSLIIKASSEWINNVERVFPVYIDPQIIAPLIALPLFSVYQITQGAQANITYTSGDIYITNYDKKIGINVPVFAMSAYNVNSLKIQFVNTYDWGAPNVPFSYVNCSVKLPDFDYINNCSGKTAAGDNFNAIVNITNLYNQWVTNNQEYGTVIFLHEVETEYDWWILIEPMKIIVEYTLVTKQPIDYIEIGKPLLVELAIGVEINLTPYEDSLEKGVLTTYVDVALPKVHQIFMIDGKNYYRYSNKLSSGDLYWLEWKREIKFNIVGDTLYITD